MNTITAASSSPNTRRPPKKLQETQVLSPGQYSIGILGGSGFIIGVLPSPAKRVGIFSLAKLKLKKQHSSKTKRKV